MFAALCVAVPACSMFTSAPAGTVKGTAYAVKVYGDPPETGAPIADFTVALKNSDDGRTIATVATDANGNFMFIAEAGDYSLWDGHKADAVKIEAGKTVDVKIAVLEKK
ncbi:MAG: carboxypeptidase-like regulatory domain-containing protein [Candidatus Binataceae bacterium]